MASSICGVCKKSLGLFNWTYRCSACNGYFCWNCCQKYLHFVGSTNPDPTVVCSKCYKDRNALIYSRFEDETGPIDDQTTPSLLLIHGALGTRKGMIFQERFLSQNGIHVINMDLPGHGSRVGQALTMDSAVECAKEAIAKKAHGGKAFVFGYSLGGYVTMRLIEKYPSVVRGAIIGGAMNESYGFKASMMYQIMGITYKL